MQKFIQNPYPPLKPPTWKKSSNPHEKTKPKNLKQINTHKENQTQVRESDLIGSFPHSLGSQTHKKIIISFNFVALYQTRSMTHMPRPGDGAPMWWCWSRAMEAMHVPIYFECYDVHDDMKRVPKEFMNSIRKNKVGFWVDRRKSVVLFGHGFLVWSLVSFAMGLLVWSKGLEWSKSKREMESERIQEHPTLVLSKIIKRK